MKGTALITGASSGIGLELAKLFAADGHSLVLVARSEKALQSLATELQSKHSISVRVLPKDLTANHAAEEIFAELQKESVAVDFLINNAGFSVFGLFATVDYSATVDMLQVNMVALTQLTRLFLDPMIQRKSGRIMNVASTAAFQPGPLMSVYYATKAYVLSFSEALANELRGTGVSVTVLCPGPTATGFQQRARLEGTTLEHGGVLGMMNAPAVAKKGYDGMMQGKTVVIPGLMNHIVAVTAQIVPRKVATQIARNLQERKA